MIKYMGEWLRWRRERPNVYREGNFAAALALWLIRKPRRPA